MLVLRFSLSTGSRSLVLGYYSIESMTLSIKPLTFSSIQTQCSSSRFANRERKRTMAFGSGLTDGSGKLGEVAMRRGGRRRTRRYPQFNGWGMGCFVHVRRHEPKAQRCRWRGSSVLEAQAEAPGLRHAMTELVWGLAWTKEDEGRAAWAQLVPSMVDAPRRGWRTEWGKWSTGVQRRLRKLHCRLKRAGMVRTRCPCEEKHCARQGTSSTHPYGCHMANSNCQGSDASRRAWRDPQALVTVPKLFAHTPGYNFYTTLHLIRGSIYKLKTSKLWFVRTAKISGILKSSHVKTCQTTSKACQNFIGWASSNILQFL
jgi:hypothetical protein